MRWFRVYKRSPREKQPDSTESYLTCGQKCTKKASPGHPRARLGTYSEINAMIFKGGSRRIFLIVLFVALVSLRVDGERLPLKTYTTADGLAHNVVNRIVRDSRGFLWFCTFEGLSRFDGYTFTTYGIEDGLPSAVVNDLLETRDGVYWVATDSGLGRFNPKGMPARQMNPAGGADSSAAHSPIATRTMFSVYQPGEDQKSKQVTALVEDHSGVLWCGTARGLYRVERNDERIEFRFIDLGMPSVLGESRNVTSMIEDRKGSLWIGSQSGIYRLLQDQRVEHYTRRDGLLSDDIRSLIEDREGHIWIGTIYEGLCRLVSDPDSTKPIVARVYSTKDGLPAWINQLFQASDGTLWAGSNYGLIRFIQRTDNSDYRFRLYAQQHGLASDQVQALAEDSNGNLWLSMANAGVAKLARTGITAFTEADGFVSARALFMNRAGDLFVMATAKRETQQHYEETLIDRFDGERFSAIKPRLPDKATYGWGWNQLLLEDQAAEWWMATDKGLVRFPKVAGFDQLAGTSPKAVYTTRDGLAANNILRIFEDSRGDIWVSSVNGPNGHGLSRWDRATQTFHHYTAVDGLPSLLNFYPISFVEDRSGNVWIGFSFGGGLVRYGDGRFTRFTSANDLPEGGIFNLFIDSGGKLWIPTTRGGVTRIDHPEADHPSMATYTIADGLSSNDVKAITEDRWGRIYFAGGRGIDRLGPATKHIRHFTANEGVPGGNANAALQDRDGALWFSYATGLMRIVPEPDLPPIAPPVLITGLGVSGSAQPVSALGDQTITLPDLKPNQNQIQINFVGLSFAAGDVLRYQYKLGAADWSAATEQRVVNFANLGSGRYQFMVRAVNSDGAASLEPAVVDFRILPPLWLRWWFLTLAVLAAIAVAYLIYRYRLTRLLELANMRTRIATDLHDDIGANLTRISILSEVAKQQFNNGDEERASPLTSIAEIARESVASMSDIVWAIDPNRDSLRDLVRKMRQHADEVFTLRDIDLEFNAPDPDLDLRLGADMRRDLLLIFKEVVNNAARHSKCSRVVIDFSADSHRLFLRIVDNGCGFDPNSESAGHGLMSLRRRAEKLNGKLQINSEAKAGTTITVNVPVTKASRTTHSV